MDLPVSDRELLLKLIALFSSPYDGEVVAAARAFSRFGEARGGWQSLINPPAPIRQLPRRCGWRLTVSLCLAKPGKLHAWERKFLVSLREFSKISDKQRNVLNLIAERVLGLEVTL